MSGIAGILRFDGQPVGIGEIERLTDAMRSRGPDAINHWREGPVALGHCMLRTTPESREESQPLLSGDGQLVLVFDGRLDNREELAQQLRQHGIEPRTPTDAELVLGAYWLWGEESPKHLLGDFAYAVWDAKQQKLFCVRDHMGARPFYYVCNQHIFAFASEDEALPGLPGVSHLPNEERIAYLLAPEFHDFDLPPAWLKDVLPLMPAQSLVISGNGMPKVSTYWRLEPGEESVFASDEECQQAFLEVFGEAVRCRLRSAGPVAAMMSGGLDSAGIAAMVTRLLPEMPEKEFHTYSAISDHPETCVESQCIQSLTKDMGANAHFVSVPSFQGMASVEDLIDIAWSRPHPVDNSILLPMMMCQAASRQSHRVVLNGVSGDLTMHVPDRYPAFLMRAGQWRRAWQECRSASRNNTYLRGSSPLNLGLRNVSTAYLPESVRSLVRRLRRQSWRLAPSTLKPAFAEKLQLAERRNHQRRTVTNSTIGEVHVDVVSSSTLGIVLGLTGYERAAGRFGVELRDPWADRRVVEFFVRLPLRYKVRDGWTKWLARTAFGTELAANIRHRLGKEHLGWQFACRLMTETSSFVSQAIKQELDYALGDYMNLDAIRIRFQHFEGNPNHAEQIYFYELVTILLWLRRADL